MLKVDDQKFKYLGSTLTEDNNSIIEIKERIVKANGACYSLRK
jgi:hypothetical protein